MFVIQQEAELNAEMLLLHTLHQLLYTIKVQRKPLLRSEHDSLQELGVMEHHSYVGRLPRMRRYHAAEVPPLANLRLTPRLVFECSLLLR